MATIFNKRQHNLVAGDIILAPGQNEVDDEVWAKASGPGTQLEQWSRLNWLGVKRSLPQAKAGEAVAGAQPAQSIPGQPAQGQPGAPQYGNPPPSIPDSGADKADHRLPEPTKPAEPGPAASEDSPSALGERPSTRRR